MDGVAGIHIFSEHPHGRMITQQNRDHLQITARNDEIEICGSHRCRDRWDMCGNPPGSSRIARHRVSKKIPIQVGAVIGLSVTVTILISDRP